MAIYRLLKHSAFNPDEIEIIAAAYEHVLSALNLPNGDSPVTRIVAKKIIEIAQTSDLDPARISTQVIVALGVPRAA